MKPETYRIRISYIITYYVCCMWVTYPIKQFVYRTCRPNRSYTCWFGGKSDVRARQGKMVILWEYCCVPLYCGWPNIVLIKNASQELCQHWKYMRSKISEIHRWFVMMPFISIEGVGMSHAIALDSISHQLWEQYAGVKQRQYWDRIKHWWGLYTFSLLSSLCKLNRDSTLKLTWFYSITFKSTGGSYW